MLFAAILVVRAASNTLCIMLKMDTSAAACWTSMLRNSAVMSELILYCAGRFANLMLLIGIIKMLDRFLVIATVMDLVALLDDFAVANLLASNNELLVAVPKLDFPYIWSILRARRAAN